MSTRVNEVSDPSMMIMKGGKDEQKKWGSS